MCGALVPLEGHRKQVSAAWDCLRAGGSKDNGGGGEARVIVREVLPHA